MLTDQHISLAHGNGGRYMRELIEEIFVRHLGAGGLDAEADAVAFDCGSGEWMITTDGFTVQPLEFPGGSIGSLAVHGTVNDLAVAGARPRHLTLNAFIEEGMAVAQLDRIVADLARAAGRCGVSVIAGDTKVLRRGEGGGLYLATTGVGERLPGVRPALGNIRQGDTLIVSGTLGDHGTAVMLAREDFDLKGDLESDSAPVHELAARLMDFPGLRFMRDPTRGGVASVAHEISRASGFGVTFDANLPVSAPVQSVCDMLGYDPCYLASEGRLLAVIDSSEAERAVAALRELPGGENATAAGRITAPGERVTLATELGGERFLEELEDDPLPRIC
jgi:hydrogenase expression/formation protein HypE